jgi:hypothetical protein
LLLHTDDRLGGTRTVNCGTANNSLGPACWHITETAFPGVQNEVRQAITDYLTSTAASLTPSAFVGDWYVHGGGMTIRRNGTGTSSFKLYETCTRDGITQCYGETSLAARLSPDGKTATLTIKSVRYVTYVGSTPHEVTNLEWKSGAPDWLKAGTIWRYQFIAPGIIGALGSVGEPNMCNDRAPAGACGA